MASTYGQDRKFCLSITCDPAIDKNKTKRAFLMMDAAIYVAAIPFAVQSSNTAVDHPKIKSTVPSI